MKKIFKKIMITASGVLLLTCTAAGAWKISGRSRNVLITASFSNRIIEEYQIPDHVNPGQKISKIVNVKNTGTRDSFIRLRITVLYRYSGTGKDDKGAAFKRLLAS